MKNILLFISVILFSIGLKAQVAGYTPESHRQFPYVKIDSGFALPFRDTLRYRNIDRPGLVVCRPQDSLLYRYTGVYWELFGTVGSVSNKVDSVTVTGQYLFYWINGTSYGYLLPTAGWGYYGDVGTDAHVLGTTNGEPLRFIVYDTIRMVIDTFGLVGIGNQAPDAILDVTSTSSGILIPRMTTAQRNAIVNPLAGELIWNTTDSTLNQYRGVSGWAQISTGPASAISTLQEVTTAGNTTTNNILIDPGLGNSLDLGSGITFNQTSGSRVGLLTKLSQTGNRVWSLPDATGTIALTSYSPGSYWGITGNSATVAGTNFIGTTDDVDVVMKANATEQLRILASGGIRIPTTTSSATGVIYKGTNRFIHNFALAGTSGDNLFVGLYAGNFTMTGSTGIQGSYNTGFGQSALQNNTTGFRNTAIGTYSLQNNTTGYSNVTTGHTALQNNTTGYNNNAIGTRALLFNTTGFENTAVGVDALFTNTTGYGNSAYGLDAMYLNTTGYGNTALGCSTLHNNTTGFHNTAVGDSTGWGITTGSRNTILGANVTGLATDLNNNIIIADGAGNRRINVDSLGNVGIGTATPAATSLVDITSTTKGLLIPRMTTTERNAISSPATGLMVWNTTTATLNEYTGAAWQAVSSASNLTVGTTTITSGTNTRVLYNNAGVVGEYTNTGTGTENVLSTAPTFVTNITTPLIIGGTAVGSNITYKSTTGAGTTTGISHQFVGGTDGATVAMTVLNNGNISTGASMAINSVNTSAPTSILDIHGTGSGAGQLRINNRASPGNYWDIGRDNNSTGELLFTTGTAATAQVRFLTNGNVGIGTTAPTARLHIAQTATATGALVGIRYVGAVNTNQTASTEIPAVTFTTAGRQWATGALTTQREVLITAPTYSFVGASTITDAATFAIAGAPVASTNATITNPFALWVQGGATKLAGTLAVDGATTIAGAFNYGVDAGSDDTYVITLSPAPTAYIAGMMIIFDPNTLNTDAASINVNSLGAQTIVKRAATTLATNDILADKICILVYNGTNFQLINPATQ